jgi:molybdopterin synthase catalytic subunit
MEALKARVPIWKKEIFEGASAEGVWKANGLGAFAASEAAS